MKLSRGSVSRKAGVIYSTWAGEALHATSTTLPSQMGGALSFTEVPLLSLVG